MISWYRGPYGRVAYSVRPDLWPAGSWVLTKHYTALADWTHPGLYGGRGLHQVEPGAGQPGVAESLILDGQIWDRGRWPD